SVAGTNLLMGAGGQIYMAIGTDGSMSMGTSTPGVGYNAATIGTSASVNGTGILNIDNTGTVELDLNMISLGTSSPLTWNIAGYAIPATISIQQSAANGYSVPLIISHTIDNGGETMMGFESSTMMLEDQWPNATVPQSWVLGVFNPDQGWVGISNHFF